MYAYPKMVVADAQDGMEYPMLTLDGGLWPEHRDLIAHEVGHNWFFGMVGSNETYRAFMDEGFTQFLTVWLMDKLAGENQQTFHPNPYVRAFLQPYNNRFNDLYYPYLSTVWDGRDKTLNMHSSDFGSAIGQGGGYGLVYFKTGVMLYNLRYVLGEELFLKAMQHYVRKWKIASPYPEDFREAIIEYTKVDLNWFFDQWLETTKTIDYSISSVHRESKTGKYELLFRRLGEMQMPLDFTVTLEDGSQRKYHIPNTWFVKPTDATVLPRWTGHGLLHPEYKAILDVPGKIKAVEIDPKHFMADVDLRNNRTKRVNHWSFDHRVPLTPRWDATTNYLRPDIWYNKVDGVKVGLHAESNYLNKTDFYSVTGWYNTRGTKALNAEGKNVRLSQLFGGLFSYRSNLSRVWQGLSLNLRGMNDAGMELGEVGLEKEFRQQDQQNQEYSVISLSLKSFEQHEEALRLLYRLYPELWQAGLRNTTLNFGYTHAYPYPKGSGRLSFLARTSAFNSDYKYSLLNLTARNETRLGKLESPHPRLRAGGLR